MKSDTLKLFMLARKPEWTDPRDIAVMAYLIAQADDQGKCQVKVADICAAVGVMQFRSVKLSTDRLEEHGWITTEYRAGIASVKQYTVNERNLPRWDWATETPEPAPQPDPKAQERQEKAEQRSRERAERERQRYDAAVANHRREQRAAKRAAKKGGNDAGEVDRSQEVER